MGGGHPLPYPPPAYFHFALRHAPVDYHNTFKEKEEKSGVTALTIFQGVGGGNLTPNPQILCIIQYKTFRSEIFCHFTSLKKKDTLINAMSIRESTLVLWVHRHTRLQLGQEARSFAARYDTITECIPTIGAMRKNTQNRASHNTN